MMDENDPDSLEEYLAWTDEQKMAWWSRQPVPPLAKAEAERELQSR